MKLAIQTKRTRQELELPDRLDGITLADLPQPAIQNFPSWDHQRLMFNFLQTRGSGLLWAGMGTGKTKVAIDCVQNSAAQRVLILSPKAVLPVWRREIARHCVIPHDVRILDQAGTAAKARELEKLCSSGIYLGFAAVNYESSWREPLADRLHEIAWDFVICDESQKIKSNRSRASQFARSLDVERRICMSGTPLPAGPEDIFSQMDFLERDVLGEWWEFADDYLTFRPQTMQVVDYRNLDCLAQRIAPHVLQVPSTVLDLPEISHQTIPVQLGRSTRKQYEIVEERLAESEGELRGMKWLVRLQQVTSGFIPESETDLGAHELHPIGREKIETLTELLSELDEPVVVFCRFIRTLKEVAALTRQMGRRYAEISGARKDGLTTHGEMNPEADVVGVQLQAGSSGIDLTHSAVAFFVEHPWSFGDFSQAIARLHRPGQTKPVRCYHLAATDSIDEAVLSVLEKKEDVSAGLLSAVRQTV